MKADAPAPEPRLSWPTLLAFSMAGLPVAALSTALFVYLPNHFARHLGVGLATISFAWFWVRILDTSIDPVLGFVMDKTRTPLGRYRAWMALGTPILMLGVFMLFMAPYGIGRFYILFWLLIYYFGYSILLLGHSAWAATLATQYHERSRVFGWITAVGVISTVAVLFVPIVAHAMGRTDSQGVQAMGWFVVLLAPLSVGIALWRAPERITTDTTKHFSLAEYIELATKPELLRLILAQMSLTLGPGWMGQMYFFFFISARAYSSGQATFLLVLYILAGVLGAPATAALARRLGKHRTLMVTTTAYSLGLCAVMVVPKANVLLAVPVMLWCGFMAAGFDLMIRAMTADVGDEIRLHHGKERTSLLYSLLSLAAKIAAAVAIFVSYWLLDWVGFKAADGAVNTPQAIHGLELIFILGPIFFVLLGGACVIGWRLDANRHAEIRAVLDARDAETREPVYSEAPILESLTGQPAMVLAAEGPLDSDQGNPAPAISTVTD